MINKKKLNSNLLKASILSMLAFSAICPTWAQEIVSLSEVNSPYDEQHPVMSPSGDLFFTVAFAEGDRDPGDVWKSTSSGEMDFQKPAKMAALSTIGYDVVVGFLDEHNILVYHDGKGRPQGIHQYVLTGSDWNYQGKLDIQSFRNNSTQFSGRLSSSGDVLILSLESYGSYGNEDIYVSFLKEGGKWSTPQNLGPIINTYQQEMTPYLSEDNRQFFFSTNGHGSTRGRDIYYSQRMDDTWESWSAPQPLAETNTMGADLSYMPLKGDRNLAIYTTTLDSEGYGDIQIIKAAAQLPESRVEQVVEVEVQVAQPLAELAPEEESGAIESPSPRSPKEAPVKTENLPAVPNPPAVEKEIPPVQEMDQPSVVVLDSTHQMATEPLTSSFPLQVLDINSLAPITYSITFIDSEGRTLYVGRSNEGRDGIPEMVDSAVEWVLASPGYLPVRTAARTKDQLKEPVLMTPASKGTSMVLEDILFKRGTSELAEDRSLVLVTGLADFLKENSGIRILLEGHTDNLGNAQLNKELSLNRASAIRQLLVDQGISFERIRIAGWGGSKPIADNQTEEGRTKNRRVEMVIQ
jgi:outer membrane protein OmpA-like peptidoglycan-associated protein